jgi:hypothetical protein
MLQFKGVDRSVILIFSPDLTVSSMSTLKTFFTSLGKNIIYHFFKIPIAIQKRVQGGQG